MKNIDKIEKKRVSETAGFVTYFRACSYKEKKKDFRGSDYLAKDFHIGSARIKLALSKILLPILKRYIPGTYEWVVARTFFIDEVFMDGLKNNFDQIILLGAGFDSRAYRFHENIRDTHIFEVDTESTQLLKKMVLKKNNIRINKKITFIPVDFDKEDIKEKLFESGFKANKKNLFIWEGVTEYLTEKAIDNTLDFIHTYSEAESKIVFTYIYKEVLDGNYKYYGSKEIIKMVTKFGEPYTFGIPEEQINSFLTERGFKIIEHLSPEDLEKRFLTNKNGKLYGKISGHQCVALAEVVTPI